MKFVKFVLVLLLFTTTCAIAQPDNSKATQQEQEEIRNFVAKVIGSAKRGDARQYFRITKCYSEQSYSEFISWARQALNDRYQGTFLIEDGFVGVYVFFEPIDNGRLRKLLLFISYGRPPMQFYNFRVGRIVTQQEADNIIKGTVSWI